MGGRVEVKVDGPVISSELRLQVFSHSRPAPSVSVCSSFHLQQPPVKLDDPISRSRKAAQC